jgi:hypothetical protein
MAGKPNPFLSMLVGERDAGGLAGEKLILVD